MCNFCGCTMHHIVKYCKKLCNNITYSIMKWYITVLLRCNVCHLSISHSKHKSITSEGCSSSTIHSKWVTVFLTLFETKCGCLIGWGTFTLEGILYISNIFYKVVYFFAILWLYWICNISLHDHWIMFLLQIQISLYFGLEIIDHYIPYIFFNKFFYVRAWPSCLQKLQWLGIGLGSWFALWLDLFHIFSLNKIMFVNFA